MIVKLNRTPIPTVYFKRRWIFLETEQVKLSVQGGSLWQAHVIMCLFVPKVRALPATPSFLDDGSDIVFTRVVGI